MNVTGGSMEGWKGSRGSRGQVQKAMCTSVTLGAGLLAAACAGRALLLEHVRRLATGVT